MAEFHVAPAVSYVYDATGDAHKLIGWLHSSGMSTQGFEPVVENPDGPGIGPWKLYHGDDPWTVA